jgi:hypothetical protein
VSFADDADTNDGRVNGYALEAIEAALLALVEQQRIANTLAAINEYGRDTLSWPPLIREALGIK